MALAPKYHGVSETGLNTIRRRQLSLSATLSHTVWTKYLVPQKPFFLTVNPRKLAIAGNFRKINKMLRFYNS